MTMDAITRSTQVQSRAIREQLLGAIAAFATPDPYQSGDQRLIHRFRDQVDEKSRDQRCREKCLKRVGAAEDSGYGKFLRRGDELTQSPLHR